VASLFDVKDTRCDSLAAVLEVWGIFSPHSVHVHDLGFALTSAACDVVAELSPHRLMSCQAERPVGEMNDSKKELERIAIKCKEIAKGTMSKLCVRQ